MRKATISGKLTPISKCEIRIPLGKDKWITDERTGQRIDAELIELNNVPDISDSKSAVYNNEAIIGRSFPLYTYSHSGDRTINIQMHFYIVNPGDGARNLRYLRTIASATYPREGMAIGTATLPYRPPPICRIKCGDLLATQGEHICAVLQSYSVKFPTEVTWDEFTYCPHKFDVDTTWLTVYSSENLPWQSRIFRSGR